MLNRREHETKKTKKPIDGLFSGRINLGSSLIQIQNTWSAAACSCSVLWQMVVDFTAEQRALRCKYYFFSSPNIMILLLVWGQYREVRRQGHHHSGLLMHLLHLGHAWAKNSRAKLSWGSYFFDVCSAHVHMGTHAQIRRIFWMSSHTTQGATDHGAVRY